MPHKEIRGIPSVTQIIGALNKPWLHKWYGKYGTEHCEKIKKTSQQFGRRIHSLIEANILAGRVANSRKFLAGKMVHNFDSWKKKEGFRFVCVEPSSPLISSEYGYQGTFDAIGYLNQSPNMWIFDWKTSNRLDETVGLQLSAYAYLYGEKVGWQHSVWEHIPNGYAVRLDKETGKLETHLFHDLKYYFDVFVSLILPYQFMTKTGGWEKPE